MSTLYELQRQLRLFIADGEAQACTEAVNESPVLANERLGIFRNNSLVTHTRALAAVFPVVRRLVDPAFFAYLADEFFRSNPPTHPCLSEYGDTFGGFLARFQPVAELAYLEDVARLEWAASRVASVPPREPLTVSQFASRADDPALARLNLHAGIRFIASKFPIDQIWRMNQPGNVPQSVEIESRAVYLAVRSDRTELLTRLDKSDWIFRSLLAAGDVLGAAFETTLKFDPHFDLTGAIARLFSDGMVVSCD